MARSIADGTGGFKVGRRRNKHRNVYRTYVDTNGLRTCELNKGLCFGAQGKHLFKFNSSDELNYKADKAGPCHCEACKNRFRLCDICEDTVKPVTEQDLLKNHAESLSKTEAEIDEWYESLPDDEDSINKLLRILELVNSKACYSESDYPNIRSTGIMSYYKLEKVQNVLETKLLEDVGDGFMDDYRWENIELDVKRWTYMQCKNAQRDLERFRLAKAGSSLEGGAEVERCRKLMSKTYELSGYTKLMSKAMNIWGFVEVGADGKETLMCDEHNSSAIPVALDELAERFGLLPFEDGQRVKIAITLEDN